jgi:hypothetical protein
MNEIVTITRSTATDGEALSQGFWGKERKHLVSHSTSEFAADCSTLTDSYAIIF